MTFEFEGKRIRNTRQLLTFLIGLEDLATATRFMDALVAHDPEARRAVGYLAGYCEPSVCRRIHWFTRTTHPTDRWPTFDDVFRGTVYSSEPDSD